MAKRSVRCFAKQTYPRAELVIVSTGDRAYRHALEQYLDNHGVSGRIVAANAAASLGALRNLSLDAAAGDIVCQWDDDDCYHPDRIICQFEQMTQQAAQACFLTDNLHLLEPDGYLYWIDWSRGSKDAQWYRLFPPTLMMINDDRFRYVETGATAQLGEDLNIAAQLCQEVPVAMMGGMGWLYLYVFHGENTCSRKHHYAIANRRSIPNESVEARADEIRRAIHHYTIQRPVVICGKQGPVFSIL
jgi:glycosyltransferase involved in cell wall biosynthesis